MVVYNVLNNVSLVRKVLFPAVLLLLDSGGSVLEGHGHRLVFGKSTNPLSKNVSGMV